MAEPLSAAAPPLPDGLDTGRAVMVASRLSSSAVFRLRSWTAPHISGSSIPNLSASTLRSSSHRPNTVCCSDTPISDDKPSTVAPGLVLYLRAKHAKAHLLMARARLSCASIPLTWRSSIHTAWFSQQSRMVSLCTQSARTLAMRACSFANVAEDKLRRMRLIAILEAGKAAAPRLG
ncbi:hypothetical protein kam1_352 [Methylacidiphilum kamchatkense Kam1]|uniref:Uncharacterized protein n=1 Tax=Methylacidiphilum kamchatkense Kam1 TaxID=1202785 RepID=A0A516TKA2_9BACT|nr:hypothetical protein kam1_352 [Methylacidiphilum kamchatkense Kam1]